MKRDSRSKDVDDVSGCDDVTRHAHFAVDGTGSRGGGETVAERSRNFDLEDGEDDADDDAIVEVPRHLHAQERPNGTGHDRFHHQIASDGESHHGHAHIGNSASQWGSAHAHLANGASLNGSVHAPLDGLDCFPMGQAWMQEANGGEDELPKSVAIIGAGVSGLACVKSCLEEGLRPVCFEATSKVGGIWVYEGEGGRSSRCRMYKSAVTNTSKEMMCFSDFPMPKSFPPFLRHETLLEYYESFARFFRLQECVKTETEVVGVDKADDHVVSGRWCVTVRPTSDPDDDADPVATPGDTPTSTAAERDDPGGTTLVSRYLFDHVIVCTGILGRKHLPVEEYEGYFDFEGIVIHAAQYRVPDAYVDKTVVIVGGANTAGDLAVEIGGVAKQVYLSMRHGTWVVNRTSGNSTPWDMASYTRFNHLCIPSWLTARLIEKLLSFRLNHEKLGLKCNKNFQQGQKMINDTIDVSILSGKVVTKPGIRSFTARGVVFNDFSRVDDVDAVIFATGYHHDFPFLGADDLGAANLDFYNHVFPPRQRHTTLAFVGCFEPNGPVAPAAELQSRWVARVFAGKDRLPISLSDRLKEMAQQRMRDFQALGYGCLIQRDEEGHLFIPPSSDPLEEALGRRVFPLLPYQEDLAARIGCRPDFLALLLGGDFRLAFSAFFGPCHPASYRLTGPGCWSGAKAAILNAKRNTDGATMTRILHPGSHPDLVNESQGGWSRTAVLTSMIIVFFVGGVIYRKFRNSAQFCSSARSSQDDGNSAYRNLFS